ncbi:partial Modification methylase DpnIIB, partial [Thermoflexales bacterium]
MTQHKQHPVTRHSVDTGKQPNSTEESSTAAAKALDRQFVAFSEVVNRQIAIADCVPHPRNYNQHDEEQLNDLRASLRIFGQVRSIVVQAMAAPKSSNATRPAATRTRAVTRQAQPTGYMVVAGHGIWTAAKMEGLTHVKADIIPVDWSETRVLAYLAADNELARRGNPDQEQLAAIVADVQRAEGDELARLAAGEEKALRRLLEHEAGESNVDAVPQIDRAAELAKKWKVKPGQLWQLGEHRLICGDCTDIAVVQRLMAGERAVLFATDPPYLVDYDGNNHPQEWKRSKRPQAADGDQDNWDASEQGEDLYEGFITVALEQAIVENAAWYCWHASRRQAMVEEIWKRHGAFVHQQIIWRKVQPVLSRSWYLWQHEPCFFGWLKGHKPARRTDVYLSGVWDMPAPTSSERTDHPTEKPVELFAIPMRQHTVRGDIWYEPFSGSGSQIIAGEHLGRRVRAIEKNPGFVAVALQRYLD